MISCLYFIAKDYVSGLNLILSLLSAVRRGFFFILLYFRHVTGCDNAGRERNDGDTENGSFLLQVDFFCFSGIIDYEMNKIFDIFKCKCSFFAISLQTKKPQII